MAEPGAEITGEDRKEMMRLRGLLVNPGSVQLVRGEDNRAWLTDQYVLLDVTSSPAVSPDLRAGLYRLVGTKGFVVKEGIPAEGLTVWLDSVERFAWCRATPTRLSVTDNEAKAMLVYVDAMPPEGGSHDRIPLAMNEDIWHAFRQAYPLATLWHAGYGGPFRVSVPDNDELAYIQPVRIPLDMHKCVQAVLEAIEDAEHKGDTGTRGE